jgi:ubiquitin thioesterase protein OTUB1
MKEGGAESTSGAESQDQLIEDEIRANAMIGVLISPSTLLLPLFANADMPGFVPGIHFLADNFDMRQVRGDGNCFYRAMLYSYLELLVIGLNEDGAGSVSAATEELDRMKGFIVQSKEDLIEIGYAEFAIESFHDMFVELLEGLTSMNREALFSMFQEDGSGDYYTWYMRALCACSLRRNSDRFFPFIDDGMSRDMKAYCEREVEPMGKEVEQVQIMALAEYIGLGINIHCLDGRPFDAHEGISEIKLPSNGAVHAITVHLLYRPGHYDILYPKA